MHFGFNNQFIKVMRTWPIFQKIKKKNILFYLISGIMNLYVKRIPDIKNDSSFVDIRMVRFYPNKIRISLLRRTFLKP